MIRIEDLDMAHEEAIQYIMKAQKDEYIGNFTKWLMNTEVPYVDVFEKGWNSFNSSIEVESFLSIVRHALIDDGDISFPVINGVPNLIFHQKSEVSPTLISLVKQFIDPNDIKIEFLDSIDEFIEQVELYQKKEA